MKDNWSVVLVHIARNAGLFDSIKTSTSKISREVGLSQQSVSRIIKEMEAEGLITRNVQIDGQQISVTNRGVSILESYYLSLKSIFEKKTKKIKGTVKAGLGEGGYYVSLKGYRKQFRQKLDFVPFPGTLNLKVKESEARSVTSSPNFMVIEGFSTKKRSYGALKAYRIKIGNKIKGAIVVPERTNHGAEILEIIAPTKLRDELNLKDDDEISITVE